jgi:hypothetical protein
MILGPDHCEAAGACKSEIGKRQKGKKEGIARLRFRGGCEANHTHVTAPALFRAEVRPPQPARIEPMKARRMAYWWFRFVVSGRFFEKFLKLRRP